jgi:hypothetical protein
MLLHHHRELVDLLAEGDDQLELRGDDRGVGRLHWQVSGEVRWRPGSAECAGPSCGHHAAGPPSVATSIFATESCAGASGSGARASRMADALQQWAFCSLRGSPGARAYYDAVRARNIGHQAALRQLSNRLVGILHGCLKTRTGYNEQTAWSHSITAAA